MKKTFDLIASSPTQWVLVDKTRIPRIGETYLDGVANINAITIRYGQNINAYKIGHDAPILAAYPKIEGVPLLPGSIWEKQPLVSDNDLACEILARSATLGKRSIIDREMKKFAQGAKWMQSRYEAAGGYTIDDMREVFDEGFALGEAIQPDGLGNDSEFNEFMHRRQSPRSLVIEVNEDGSLPSENGVLIVHEVIR